MEAEAAEHSQVLSPASAPRFALNFDTTCGLLALAPIALRVLMMPIPPHDFWWHMAQGRLLAQSGQVPQFDVFSWTRPGAPFYNQSWLSQGIFYALHQLGGVALLLFVQALLITLSYALLLRLATRRIAIERHSDAGAMRVVALVLTAVMLTSFDNWLVRPQSYAIPIFVAFFTVLTNYRLGYSKVLWPLPLLMIMWVNIHGSFVLGIGLLAIVLLAEWCKMRSGNSALNSSSLRLLAVWSAITIAALLINPRGIEVLSYVKMMLADPSNKFSAEWLSPTPRSLNDALFFVFAIAFFVTLIYARRRPDLTDILLAVAFFWLAITSGRYIIWFAIVAMPTLALAIASHQKSPPSALPSTLNTALVAIFWLMVLPCLPWLKPALDLPSPMGDLVSEETPVSATKVLRSLPEAARPRRLFHNPPTGSYLTWAAPEQKVFIDTRFEFYPPQQWRDYLQLSNGENVENLLQKYAFDGLLLDAQQEKPLLQALKNNDRWQIRHHDKRFVLLLPRQSS
jgi:hypothetical protein